MGKVCNDWNEFIKFVHGEEELDPNSVQYREMRKAFYSGYARSLFYLMNEMSLLPEDRGVEILEELRKEVMIFWEEQVLKEQ